MVTIIPKDYNPLLYPGRNSDGGFVSLMKRIGNFVVNIFNKIGEFFRRLIGRSHLTARDLELIQNARAFAKPAELSIIPIPRENLVEEVLVPVKSESEILREHKTEYPEIADPTMKEFHETAQQLIETVVDAFYEEKIEGALTNIQVGMERFPQGLKAAADLVIQIGNKSAKPIFDIVKSATLEEKFQPDYINLINWLRSGETRDALTIKLEKALENEKIKDIKSFINPCLHWLFDATQQKSFAHTFQDYGIYVNDHKVIIDKVLEKSLTLLLNNKLDDFVETFQKDLGERLPEIIHSSLKENITRITDILIRRFVAISEKAPYQRTFDAVIELLADQTGLIAAVEQRKDAVLAEGRSLQTRANVDVLTDEWLEQWVEKESVKAFTNYKVVGKDGVSRKFCHPNIVTLLTDSKMTAAEKEKIEEQMFDNLAKELISVVFPKQKVMYPDGKVEEVDGLIFLCGQIQLPSEFTAMSEYALNISKKIITPTTKNMVLDLYNTTGNIIGDQIKELVIFELKKLIHQGMVKAARTLFSQFVTPQLIDQLMAEEIFPMIQKEIISAAVKQLMKKRPDFYVQDFYELVSIDAPDVHARTTKKNDICKKLHAEVQTVFNLYRNQFNHLSEKEFQDVLETDLVLLEEGLRNFFEGKEITTNLVRTALDGYFQDLPHDNNLQFGDILVNALFGIGKFKGFLVNVVVRLFKGKISDLMSEAAAKLRRSPHHMIHIATLQMKKKLDVKSLREKMFAEKKEVTAAETQERLKIEIQNTALAAKDLVSHLSSAASKALGTETELASLITDVYAKVFGDKHKVHNLLLKAQEVALSAMSEASVKIEGFTGHSPVKMSRPPTVLPYLFKNH